MSAFRRRTTFAAPVILTVAACSSGKDKPTSDPVRPFLTAWQVRMDNMRCEARQTGNPPPPTQEVECPPGMTGGMYMTVAMIADGRCAVAPPGCNDATCAKPITPCPLPPGQKLVKKLAYVWIIEKRGDRCHAE